MNKALSRILVLCALLLQNDGVFGQQRHEAAREAAVYFDDTQHLWNKLHRALFERTTPTGAQFGIDTVDPLLWLETTHLLEGESHTRAIALLEDLLMDDGARDAPHVARALLQHELWSVFDWTLAPRPGSAQLEPARKALRIRLAKAILQLALSKAQIGALPEIGRAHV